MSIAFPQYESAPTRTVSQARLEANRRNARKSTGPRTAAGKARSSQNARKHWGRTQGMPAEPTIPHRPHTGVCSDDPYVAGEDAATFAMHAQEMHEALLPLTLLQKQEFPQMVALQWSILRAIDTEREIIEALAEAGEPPCRTLARVFLASPNNNPIVAHARYVRAQNRDFWRRLREFDKAGKRPQPVDPREQWEWELLKRERERAEQVEHLERMVAEDRAKAEAAAACEEAAEMEHGWDDGGMAEASAAGETPAPREADRDLKRTQTKPNEPHESGDIASESTIGVIEEDKTKPRGEVVDGPGISAGERKDVHVRDARGTEGDEAAGHFVSLSPDLSASSPSFVSCHADANAAYCEQTAAIRQAIACPTGSPCYPVKLAEAEGGAFLFPLFDEAIEIADQGVELLAGQEQRFVQPAVVDQGAGCALARVDLVGDRLEGVEQLGDLHQPFIDLFADAVNMGFGLCEHTFSAVDGAVRLLNGGVCVLAEILESGTERFEMPGNVGGGFGGLADIGDGGFEVGLDLGIGDNRIERFDHPGGLADGLVEMLDQTRFTELLRSQSQLNRQFGVLRGQCLETNVLGLDDLSLGQFSLGSLFRRKLEADGGGATDEPSRSDISMQVGGQGRSAVDEALDADGLVIRLSLNSADTAHSDTAEGDRRAFTQTLGAGCDELDADLVVGDQANGGIAKLEDHPSQGDQPAQNNHSNQKILAIRGHSIFPADIYRIS